MRAIILAITVGTLMPAASYAQVPLGTPVTPSQADTTRPAKAREMARTPRQRTLERIVLRHGQLQHARLRSQLDRVRMQRVRLEQGLTARRGELAGQGLMLNGVELTEKQQHELQRESRERMLDVLTAEQRRQVEQRTVRRSGGGAR